MATAKQKQIAKKNRDNAVKAMKKAKKGSAAYKTAQAKVAALGKIMKSKTTATATTSGSTKLALAKVARDTAKVKRTAAVKKMQDLKPKSKAWEKAKRNVVTASSNVRKQGNIMRDVSGRGLGQYTSYTGPRESMREYIKSIEASPGGKALTKLGDPTEFTQVNQRWLAEMPGKTYAEKRQNWENQWGEPGSKNYRDMQQEQAIRHSEMINDPNYDPDYIPPIFDDIPPVTQPTGDPRTFTADIPGSVPRLYSGNIPGRMAAGGGYPNGFLSGAAQDAAQGWAGQLGFNIDPRGGLLLRPWEAQSWQLAGIDPRLWNPGTGTGPVTGPITGPIDVTGPGTGPKYPGVPPGSQQERDMDRGITHHPGFYDADGNYVGAEGGGVDAQGFETDPSGRRTGGYINDSLGIGNKILGWMGADPAEVQRTRAIMADADMDVAASVGAATQGKYGTGGYQGTGVNAQPSGLLATNPYANNPYGSFPTGQNPSAHGARWEEIDPYGIDAGGTSGYDVAAGYRAYDNAMNAAARRTAAAGGVPWGSDYANRMGALSSSNQAALDAAAFHASLTGMPNLANIATAPTIVSANPASVWGDYMDEVETEAGTGVDTTGVDTGYGGGYGWT